MRHRVRRVPDDVQDVVALAVYLHVHKLSKTKGPGRVSQALPAPVLVRIAVPRARVVTCNHGCTL